MSMFDVTSSESEVVDSKFPEYVVTDIDRLFTTQSKNWFVKYEPMDTSQEYRIHPGADVVESYPLSFVKPPIPDADDIKFGDNGELTTVQLDAVRLASYRFQQTFLESGVTKGFLLGDGPGLGKTRILAAVIYNEFLKGHKRHLFLSISDMLFQDIIGEFEKIASPEWVEAHVKNLDQIETTLRLREFEGVLFMTYHRLRKFAPSHPTPSHVSKLSGLDVIAHFCGTENPFSGVIALDESHVGKNALNPINELRSTTGQKLLEVIWTYKSAKVIYSTATPASNSNHFGIMARLGIWDSTSYLSDFSKFDKLMNKWELAASEIMALKLKHSGAMVSRQISFEGVVTRAEYVPTESEPEAFREIYDQFSNMWRQMYQDILIIASYCDSDAKKTKIATFFSAMMNFFRAIIIDSKINHLVDIITKEIEKDNVVVVGIQGTGESSYNVHTNTKDTDIDFLISNAKEIMEKLVRNHFCVALESRKKKRNVETMMSDEDSDNEERNENGNINVATKSVDLHSDLAISESEEDVEESEASVHSTHKVGDVNPPEIISTRCGSFSLPEGPARSNPNVSVFGNIDSPEVNVPVSETISTENVTASVNSVLRQENPSVSALEVPFEEHKDASIPVKVYQGETLKCVDIVEVNNIRQRWLNEIHKIENAPPNFLDEIQRRLLEYDNITVAEITGRKLYMKSVETSSLQFKAKEGSSNVCSKEALSDDPISVHTKKTMKYKLSDRLIDCDFERKEFMEGRANVAIISDAGSTGISLHASNAKEEFCKKKRVHITVELGWSAEKVLQQLGRTHRANQKQPPEYVFLLSNVPSEIRFTSIILGRLATMSTFTCAQRHIDLCHRLEEQAKFDSNAGIRGIRSALAFFFDEDVPIPYEKDVPLKYKVLTELEQLGLRSTKEKRSFGKSCGRTLKRLNLTKIMNKLLSCTINVQQVFCDVWLFYLTHFKEQYNKDQGVIVIPPSVCQVIADKNIESLIKHETEEGVVTDSDSDGEDEHDVNNTVLGNDRNLSDEDDAGSNSERGRKSQNEDAQSFVENEIAPSPSHGPVYLVPLHIFLGSTVGAVKTLHDNAKESDRISGFYDDGGFPGLHHERYFYLENKILTEHDQNFILQRKELPNKYFSKGVCMLYQPHQPPMELDANQVLEFTRTMTPLLSSVALGRWLHQASALKDSCIHKYSHGDCSSSNCVIGKRHSLKYIVTGDLPAIWSDIISTVDDEDPSVIVCKDYLTGEVRIGIEIPKFSVTGLKLKIAGHAYHSLKTDPKPPKIKISQVIEQLSGNCRIKSNE